MTSVRTAQRLTRILSMLPWVIANPGAAVDEVCERFDYTRKELLKDLDLIFVCGLPGYGPGDLMVAYVDEDEVVVDMADYFSKAAQLTPVEGLALLASALALLSTGQALPALESGVRKLEAVLLPEGDQSPLAVDLAREPGVVATFREAVAEQRVVHITYTSIATNKTTERDIEPWSVFSTLGNWYVSAYCRLATAERVFRLDRIRSAEVTDASFIPPETPPPPVVRYTPGEDDVRATIRLNPGAHWVTEYYPVEILSDADDDVVVRFSTADPSVAARLLLRLGPQAELMEGEEVREALASVRERILKKYGVTTP
ncbi:MAG: helix-turn-helix transcriptional regulator [Acidimicrobiia bacterium]